MHWSQLPTTETLLTGLVAVGILGLYLFVSRQTVSGKELLLRSLLLAVVLFSLCLIIWKPQYAKEQQTGNAFLVTENGLSVPDSLPGFVLPGVKADEAVAPITDLATLERNHPEIKQVFVAGYGLDPEETKSLHRIQLIFLQKDRPEGFNWLDYLHKVKAEEALRVSGNYYIRSEDSLKIRLVTSEGAQDSVWITHKHPDFTLNAHPRLPGNFVGEIQVIQNKEVRHEPLPYIVTPKEPLNVIVLQAYPDFETNYLKDWLADQKHRVQIRARISRDKYSFQQINLPTQKQQLAILSKASLENADLLIADTESLEQLSAQEKKQVQTAVAQGLGLLLLPDDKWSQKADVLGHKFAVHTTGIKQFIPVHLSTSGAVSDAIEKLPVAFSDRQIVVPIVYSKDKEPVAAYMPVGLGRVGVQLANGTYTWILNAKDKVYSTFWTEILQGFSRKKEHIEVKFKQFPFAWEDNISHLLYTDTAVAAMTVQYLSGSKEKIQPKIDLPETSVATYPFHPDEAGWLTVTSDNDTTHAASVYVVQADKWKDLKQASWFQTNSQIRSITNINTNQKFTTWKNIPLVWFFMALLIALFILWWREKA
ncbi:hypothetical protein [Xanthocytophaga agilis]|uniref:Uncharacterized protein n=1 Tax=Xanthocytophaga agilis TaxID=3048010 RepID=A0AAE3R7B6_9BACT|nr:hypothetical protein [Xanthocytophaga agilis]MDJ1502133.1 hypothetical protein [Xanthocytophaga agilis]